MKNICNLSISKNIFNILIKIRIIVSKKPCNNFFNTVFTNAVDEYCTMDSFGSTKELQ